ncbi:MAG: hypothetical protein HGA45_44935, partial [Chloroflexales bacterium]|nr:hypothetical protein [Chloroflexales bacterium]
SPSPAAPPTASPAAPPTASPAASPTASPAAPPTASPPPAATASPAAVLPTGAPPRLAAPTATPGFPEARLSAENVAALRPLRAVGFGGAIDAAISPDNRLLAVATSAGVALFELPSLRHLRFDPIDGGAHSLRFSPDGQSLTVATGAAYESAPTQVRRVADGAILEPAAPPEPVQPATMPPTLDSPDGRLRITYNIPDSVPTPGVRLTRVDDGRLIYEDATTEQAAFSPDSSIVALVAYDGTVSLLDAGGASLASLALPAYWSVAFSPDGLRMATAGRRVWLWDVVSGALQQDLGALAVAGESGVMGGTQRASFSPDGALLTVAGDYSIFEASMRRSSTWMLGAAGAAHAWDSEAGALGFMNYNTYAGAISPVSETVARTEDGQRLAIAGGAALSQTLQVPAGVSALAFSPDGALLAVGDKAGQIQVLRVADGSALQTLQAGAAPRVLQFSPDAARLGERLADGALQIWAVADGAPLVRIAAPPPEPGATPVLPGADPFRFTPD